MPANKNNNSSRPLSIYSLLCSRYKLNFSSAKIDQGFKTYWTFYSQDLSKLLNIYFYIEQLNRLNIQVRVSSIENPCFLQFEWSNLYLVVFNEVLKYKWRHLQTFILIPFVSYSPFTFDLWMKDKIYYNRSKKSEKSRSVLISAIAVNDLNIETILECKGSRSQFDQHFMSSFCYR
jgi:hypothetical protein